MKNLTDYQLMALYLLAFQVGEWGPENEEVINKALDEIFQANNVPDTDNIIFDEDGGPINSTEGIYKESTDWMNAVEDDMYEIISLDDIDEYNPHITPEFLISLIGEKS